MIAVIESGEKQMSDDLAIDFIVSELETYAMKRDECGSTPYNIMREAVYLNAIDSIDESNIRSVLVKAASKDYFETGRAINAIIETTLKSYVSQNIGGLRKYFRQELEEEYQSQLESGLLD